MSDSTDSEHAAKDGSAATDGTRRSFLEIVNEEFYREIFDATSDALFIHDENGAILDVNLGACRMFRCDRQTLIENSAQIFCLGQAPYSLADGLEKLHLAVADGPQLFDWRGRRFDGELFWAEIALRATSIAGSVRIIASVRDIDQRKRAEEALRESEERFRALSASATEGIMIHEDGVIVDANQAMAHVVGLSDPSEIIGKNGLDFVGFTPESRQLIVQSILSGSTESYDVELRWPDGSLVPVETSGRPTIYRGRPARLVMMRNISDRKRAERELEKNERRLSFAISATADAIWERNLQTGEVYYSPRWYTMLGYEDRELPMAHDTFRALCHPDDLVPTLESVEATLRSPQSGGYEAEFRMRAADGSWHWIRSRGNVVERDSEGQALLLSGTNTNVTERKRVEDELAEKEHRFRLMIQNVNDMLLIFEPGGTVQFVSPACMTMLGCSTRELLGMNVYGFIHPDDAAWVRQAMRGLLDSKDRSIVLEFRQIHRDGSIRWVEASGTNLVDDPTIRGFILAVRDITRRRQSEMEILEWKHRYDLLALAAGNAVYDFQVNGTVVWGGGFEEMFGFPASEMRGGFAQWLQRIHPEDCARVQAEFAVAEANGAIFKAEYRHIRQDGTYLLVEDTGYPYFDSRGKAERYIGVLQDISKRKKADEENAKLAAGLRQAQKMESIGRLAGGVAHDFNNLLTVISGNVSLAMMGLQRQDPLFESMNDISRAVDSAANLTRQLLAFSRKQVIDPKVLNLNTVVERLQKMLTRLLGEDVQLCAILSDNLGQVHIDPGQVEQVIVNLAVNSRDAMPDGGKLTLETANVTLDEAFCRAHGFVQPGEFVMLVVSDNGTGMDEQIKTHLFEPFFTTKELGKGTGLGLATVYGVVTQNKGTIDVWSEPNLGTTFRIFLPRIDAEPESLEDVSSARLLRGSETIIVVEDEDTVRELAVRILKRQGYRVHGFANGGEALMAVAELDEDIHLLITDVVMPGINGRVLANNLLKLRPSLKVLFTSGYTGDVIVHHGMLDEGIEFIAKPYTLEQLAKRVREVLDGDSGHERGGS